MNRFLLDTNIIIALVMGDRDFISHEVKEILYGYDDTLLYASPFSMMELLRLYEMKRLDKGRKKRYAGFGDLCHAVKYDFGIKTLKFGEEHIKSLSELVTVPGHNDPFDHAIIAHAITEKLTLVSSDGKFESYTALNPKLKFLFNKR